MQLQSFFRAAPPPELRAAIAGAEPRVKTVGVAVVRRVKALGSRMNAVISKPWFFPAQVVVIFGVLLLQQHGYLHIPITVCDWANVVGK